MPQRHGNRPSPSRLIQALIKAQKGLRAFADPGSTALRGPRGCPPRPPHPAPLPPVGCFFLHPCSLCGRIQPNPEANLAEIGCVGIHFLACPGAGSPRCPELCGVGAGLLGSGRQGQKQHPNPPMPPCSRHFFLCILLIPGTRAADGPQDAGRDKALLTLPEAAFPPLDSINYELF